jgi:hypothetical protein
LSVAEPGEPVSQPSTEGDEGAQSPELLSLGPKERGTEGAPTTVAPPAPSTPEQVSTTLEVLDKAIETERDVEIEFTKVVDKVQIPEIAAVLDEIAKDALVNQQRLTEIRKLASSEEKALTSEPVDLNTCYNKAMGVARTMYGAYERLTVDPAGLKEQIQMEKSLTGKAELERELSDFTKRAKDTIKAVRTEIRDTPCLLIRDKVAKMGQIDHAVELIDAGAIDAAAEVIRGF